MKLQNRAHEPSQNPGLRTKNDSATEEHKERQGRHLILTSDAIGPNGFFDPRYTCDMDNSSPEMRWMNPPDRTHEFALMIVDQTKPEQPFVHWLVYGIPSAVHHLPAGIPPQDSLPNGIKQGINQLGRLGYTGPCPAPGEPPHHYLVKLFALGSSMTLPSRIRIDEFLRAVRSASLEEAHLIGQYRQIIGRTG